MPAPLALSPQLIEGTGRTGVFTAAVDEDVTAAGACNVGTGMVGVGKVLVFNGTVGVIATAVRTGTVATDVDGEVDTLEVVEVAVADVVEVVDGVEVVGALADVDVVDVVAANGFWITGIVGIVAPQEAVVGH